MSGASRNSRAAALKFLCAFIEKPNMTVCGQFCDQDRRSAHSQHEGPSGQHKVFITATTDPITSDLQRHTQSVRLSGGVLHLFHAT